MSEVVDLLDWRASRLGEPPVVVALRHTAAARRAQERIDADTQRSEAQAAMRALWKHTGDKPGNAIAYARAVELHVDADLNDKLLPQARATAEAGLQHIRRTARKSMAEVVTRRAVLTVRELRGSADEVIHDFARWGHHELVEARGGRVPLERLRYLQHVLTCAKRCRPDLDVMPFVRMALKDGLKVAREIEGTVHDPHVACFYHVAGYSQMRFGLDRDRAADLLTRSLERRPDTPRDLATRGMGEAELLLAVGDRDEAIVRFDATVKALFPLLPRHELSARETLALRGLLAA